ncbi:MAG: 50S ribosomal protein L32 [Propioniciclava sp.]
MAVPKRRTSRSRTRHRRSQWKTEPVHLVTVRVGGETYRVPPQMVRAVQRGLITPDS